MKQQIPTENNTALLSFTLSEDKASYTVSACKSSICGGISIPSQYNGLPVTAIGRSAFNGCRNLTEVALPVTLTEIGAHAFMGCERLSGIDLPSGVTSIEKYAFCHCKSISHINIPSATEKIGEGALRDCIALSEINIDKENKTKDVQVFIEVNAQDLR